MFRREGVGGLVPRKRPWVVRRGPLLLGRLLRLQLWRGAGRWRTSNRDKYGKGQI